MAAGEEDGLDLEAMSKGDHSWHPCKVSLSSCASSGSGLIVDFENCNLEDIISTEEEALAHLRFRSIPLQDGECFHIKEGEHILAMHKTKFSSLFFDAEVEKVWRVRHSSRIHCRCSFGIRWLNPEMKGETMTVSSSSVRKLAGNSIHSHPTVAAFLNSVGSLKTSGITSCTTLLEDIDYQTDLQRLLEDQIEEISKVSDASSMAVSQEILLGVKRFEHAGHTRGKAFVASEISSLHDETPYKQNNYERSTSSQRNLQLGTETKDLSVFQPSPEDHFQKRSCLSPLAARAALASIMHELPQRPEISIYHVEKQGYVDTSQNTSEKHMDVLSLDVTRMFMNSDMCIQEKLSVASNHPSEVVSMPVASNPIQIANDTFGEPMLESTSLVSSRRGSLEKSRLMEDSNEAVALKEKSIPKPEILKDGSLNTPTATARFTRSVMNRKSNNTTVTARVTRSAIQKEIGNAADKAKRTSSTKDTNLNSPTMMKRLTRSAIQKEMGHSVNEVNVVSSTKDRMLSSPTTTTRITRSTNQEEMGISVNEFKLELSTKDRRLNSPTTTRLTSSAIQNDMGNSVSEHTLESSTEDRKLNSPSILSELTRSASWKEMGKLVNEDKLESSTEGGKLSSPAITTRLTRSTRQEEMGNSVDDVKLESSTKDRKLNSPIIRKRLTRSAIPREIGNSVDEIKIDSATKERKSCSPMTTTRLTRSAFQSEMGSSMNGVELKPAAKDRKLNTPTIMARLTRSAIQRDIGNSVDEIMTDSATKQRKSCSPITTTRLTRSAFQREMGSSVNGVELEPAAKDRKLNDRPVTTRLTRSAIQKEIGNSVSEVKVDSSINGRKLDSPVVTRLTHSTSQKEPGYSAEEVELDLSMKDRKLNGTPISTRLTRSAFQRKMENSTAKVEEEWKKGKSTQDSGADDTVGDLVTHNNKETKKKRSVFLPIDAERNASQGKRKMVKVSSTIIIIKDSDEKGGISARGEGRKVEKKPQLRFSHRLRFLPRTRSQR